MKTYNLLAVLCTLIISVNSSFAQTKVDIAIKAGLDIPDLSAGDNANPINSGYGSRLAPDGAIDVEFHLSKHFSIQPQLEYSAQGGKKNDVEGFAVPADLLPLIPAGESPSYVYANYKSVARINYLMLPLLAKYRLDLSKHLGAYIAAGPFVSLVLSAKNITSGSSNIYLDPEETQPLSPDPESFNNKADIKSDLHKFNTGFSGHIGFDYKLAKGSQLFIEGGGNYGFINIQKYSADGVNRIGASVVVIGYQVPLWMR